MTIPLHDPRVLPPSEDNDKQLLLTWNESWADRATANGDTAKLVAKTASGTLVQVKRDGCASQHSPGPGFYLSCAKGTPQCNTYKHTNRAGGKNWNIMSAAQLDEAFYHISPCLHESRFNWEEMSCTAYGHAKGWWVFG
jgi:hypothetical protein